MQLFSKSNHCCPHARTSAAMEKTDLSKAKSVTEPQPLEQPEKPLIPVVRRGRKRKDDRPRIDIDDQIQEAFRLLMKKLAHAAQMVSRNGQRVKARLINKAAKLSVQDLARVGILKRCGLMDGEEQGPSTASSSSKPATQCAERPNKAPPNRGALVQKMSQCASKQTDAVNILASIEELKEMLEAGDLVCAAHAGDPDSDVAEDHDAAKASSSTDAAVKQTVPKSNEPDADPHKAGTSATEDEELNDEVQPSRDAEVSKDDL